MIPIDSITIDQKIQLRARGIDEATVQSYVTAYANGAQLPPVVAFRENDTLWLADGFHRISALRFLGHAEIEADVRAGTYADAQLYTATANVANGRPMSQTEKREAGERLIKLTDWSDGEIARQLAVSTMTVGRWRASITNVIDSKNERTVTRNGTTYTMQTATINKKSKPKPQVYADDFGDDYQSDIPEIGYDDVDDDYEVDIPPMLADFAAPSLVEPQQAAVIPELLPAMQLPETTRLIHGDFAVVANTLQAGSFDVIITDPPYPREFLPLYGLLAQEAARLLKPGGSLVVMCGQSYIPDVIALMTPHIRYHWMLSYLTPGGQSAQIWQRKVNTFWKPVLWFVNGDYSGVWRGDVAKSAPNDNDKRFHEWGQSESGMWDLLDRFTEPGDLVLDPFCGAGTTGVVALAGCRRFVGIDTDAEALAHATRRLCDVAAA